MFDNYFLEQKLNLFSSSVVFFVLIAFSSPGVGNSHEASFSFESSDPAMTEHGKEISAPFYSVLETTIGQSTLKEVQRTLGESPVYKADNHKHSPNLLCYRARRKDDTTVIVFGSNLFGSWTTLTSILVSSNGNLKEIDLNRCRPSEKVFRESLSSNGITLDSTMNLVKKYLGRPTMEYKNNMRYIFQTQGKTRHEGIPYININSGFDAVANKDGLAWFRVYRIESY